MEDPRFEEYKQVIWSAVIMGVLFCLCVAFLEFVTGCSMLQSVSTNAVSGNAIYKYDMMGTINGVPFDGVGVIPLSSTYQMHIESREDVDLLTVTSCHRDFSVESAIQTGWFKLNRGYDYEYIPVIGIEDKGSCIVRIGAYNKSPGGQDAWALIDFE